MLLKLKSIWTEQWTGFLGWTKIAVGTVGAGLTSVGTVLNDGSVKSAIDSLNLDPKIMLGLAVLGALTLLSIEHKDA